MELLVVHKLENNENEALVEMLVIHKLEKEEASVELLVVWVVLEKEE